jgi:hypothetical protein
MHYSFFFCLDFLACGGYHCLICLLSCNCHLQPPWQQVRVSMILFSNLICSFVAAWLWFLCWVWFCPWFELPSLCLLILKVTTIVS